jgi:hypothetical protein
MISKEVFELSPLKQYGAVLEISSVALSKRGSSAYAGPVITRKFEYIHFDTSCRGFPHHLPTGEAGQSNFDCFYGAQDLAC